MTTYLLQAPAVVAKEVARGFVADHLLPEGGERVLDGRHPDVTEVEPEGTQITVAQAGAMVETAFRTPFEAQRKVIVVFEAERMNESVQNKLLKTLEEPPLDTDFLLVTAAVDELLPTVRSRCQDSTGRVRVPPVPEVDHGVLRQAFAAAPSRLDGTGSAAAAVAGELLDAVEQAFAVVKDAHEAERVALDAELEGSGYAERAAARLRKNLAERQKRVESRARVDAIVEGLAVLAGAYRDVLVSADGPAASSALAALDAVAATRQAVQEGTVLNWGLQLEALLLRLPGTLTAPPPG